jgi:hypothetical protein
MAEPAFGQWRTVKQGFVELENSPSALASDAIDKVAGFRWELLQKGYARHRSRLRGQI